MRKSARLTATWLRARNALDIDHAVATVINPGSIAISSTVDPVSSPITRADEIAAGIPSGHGHPSQKITC
jgi:hypothetical protein